MGAKGVEPKTHYKVAKCLPLGQVTKYDNFPTYIIYNALLMTNILKKKIGINPVWPLPHRALR